MKLIKILFIISLMVSVVACKPTTEERMLKALQTEQFGRKMKVVSLDIVDTLYDRQVADTLEFDRNAVKSMDQRMGRMRMHRDSMFQHRMNFPREKMDSFRSMSIRQNEMMERMRNFHNTRVWKMQDLQLTGADSDIAVYDVLIRTATDTMEFYISKNFRVLGPKFMFTNEDIRPIEGRRRPETFGPRGQNPGVLGKPGDQRRGGHTPPPTYSFNRFLHR